MDDPDDDGQPVGENPPLSAEQHAEVQANLTYPEEKAVETFSMMDDLEASYVDDLAVFDAQREDMAAQARDVAANMGEHGVPEEKRGF